MKFKYKFHMDHCWKYGEGYAFPLFLDVLSFHASKNTNGCISWWGQFDLRVLNVDFILSREIIKEKIT